MNTVLAMEILMALEGQEPMTFEDLMRRPHVRMEHHGHTVTDLCQTLNHLETHGRVRSFFSDDGERLFKAEQRIIHALDKEQTRRAIEWMKENRVDDQGAMDGQYSVVFTLTGLGVFGKIVSSTFPCCEACGQPHRIEFDLTDYESL